MDDKLYTVICYKLKTPIYYNKGTKYEKSCDHFLAYYLYGASLEEGQEEAENINKTKPEKLRTGEKINWDEIDYFYASQQEDMY